MILVPESPYYLIAKKRHSKATKVVELLNGKDDIAVQDVIKDIEKYLDQGKSFGNIDSGDKHNASTKNDVPDHRNDAIYVVCVVQTKTATRNMSTYTALHCITK